MLLLLVIIQLTYDYVKLDIEKLNWKPFGLMREIIGCAQPGVPSRQKSSPAWSEPQNSGPASQNHRKIHSPKLKF